MSWAALSPVTYLWWADFYMVLACLVVYLLTALYVTPPASNGRRRTRMIDALLKDIGALGDTYGIDAKTAVRSEKLADEAVLKEMAMRKHNLIVIGVERRPGEKLYFGETATAILENSDRSIVFVVS